MISGIDSMKEVDYLLYTVSRTRLFGEHWTRLSTARVAKMSNPALEGVDEQADVFPR